MAAPPARRGERTDAPAHLLREAVIDGVRDEEDQEAGHALPVASPDRPQRARTDGRHAETTKGPVSTHRALRNVAGNTTPVSRCRAAGGTSPGTDEAGVSVWIPLAYPA